MGPHCKILAPEVSPNLRLFIKLPLALLPVCGSSSSYLLQVFVHVNCWGLVITSSVGLVDCEDTGVSVPFREGAVWLVSLLPACVWMVPGLGLFIWFCSSSKLRLAYTPDASLRPASLWNLLM